MNENERLAILELLASKKISAQEAADMLQQLDVDAVAEPPTKLEDRLKDVEPVYKADIDSESQRDLDSEVIPWPDDRLKASDSKPRWLKIRVRDMGSNRNKVTVNVPLGLVSFGLRAARRFGADMGDFDPEMMMQMIDEGRRGLLVDVQDEEDGEHVQIFLD